MSDLLSALSRTGRALDAQRFGLDVVGQNLANANTQGYTRRQITLAEVPPPDMLTAGGGVNVVAVTAARTPLLDSRYYREQPPAGREAAVADQLGVVETALGTPGASLDARVTALFDAFAGLASDPTSTVTRSQVVAQAQALAQGFHDLSAQFAATQNDADTQARGLVDQINQLARTISQLNTAIANAPSGSTEALRDQQAGALQSLSNLIDIGVIPRQEGGVDVSVGNGQALVAAENAYPVTVTSAPPRGFAQIQIAQTDITSDITGGRLGGLIFARDVLVPGYTQRLDSLAASIVSSVNTVHTAGFDLNGATGTSFFSPLVTTAGAAAAIAVNPTVVADVRTIAAAGVAATGDNQNARALAALRNGNPSPIDDWGSLVDRVGADRQAALADLATRQDVLKQIDSLRSQVSGVSIDEEAATMLRFQRAYEANARFFSVVDRLLDTLMNTVA